MKKIAILLILQLFFNLARSQQSNHKIFGCVVDASSGEALIGATIWLKHHMIGTNTNTQGYFSLPISQLPDTLHVSCIGYKNLQVPLAQIDESMLNISMILDTIEAVIIKRPLPEHLQRSQTGLELMSSREIRTLPVILGESDITRNIQTLPGVSPGTENTSGFFVRGGSQYQNLVLIDGVPLYHAYHLYGMFSVFNTDAINTAQFYRSGMPAQYNGRLSSVLDISMNEGNNQRISGQGTLSPITSKILLEGPLIKNKTSFLVTARRSMFDIMPKTIRNNMAWVDYAESIQKNIRNMPHYSFADYSGKISHQLNARNSLTLSLYNATDDYTDYTFENKQILHWGSSLISMRWKSILTGGTFCTTTLYESNYSYSNTFYLDDESTSQNYYGLLSSINERAAVVNFESLVFQHKLKYGGQFSWYRLSPQTQSKYLISGQSSSIDTTIKANFVAREQSMFVEDLYNITPKLTLQLGVNINYHSADSQKIVSLHPRLSIGYEIIPGFTTKGSYSSLLQPLHTLQSNSLGLPSDIWVPSLHGIKPATSQQYVFGITYSPNNQWEIGFETYYKKMKNLLMYKQGAYAYADPSQWYKFVESGIGTSKGVELIISKKSGKLNGWCSYTLSKTDRRFPTINYGQTFPYDFDRRHIFNLVSIVQLTKKVKIGSTWTYMSGQPVTLAVQNILDNTEGNFWDIGYIPSLNNHQLPDYHRLDININYLTHIKKLSLELNVGAYNVYNRSNPITARRNPEGIVVVGLLKTLPYFNISLKY